MNKLAIVSTVRCSFDELNRWIQYHLKNQIDLIYLFFDDSSPEYSHFHFSSRVRTIICDDEYWEQYGEKPSKIDARQTTNATYATKLARLDGVRWLAHIDDDEVIFFKGDLREKLELKSTEQVRLKIYEAISTDETCSSKFNTHTFKIKAGKKNEALKRGVSDDVFYAGDYFRGHSVSKVFVNIQQAELYQYRVHTAVGPKHQLQTSQSSDINLLHFDGITYDSWLEKFKRRLSKKVELTGLSALRIKQMEELRDANEEKLKKIFRARKMITQKDQEILFELGMLEEIEVDI